MDQKRPATQAEINEYRRRKLMESTIRLLARKGVAGATVRAISADADTSHGLIGHYYATKDDLLVAALEHLFGSVAAEVAARIGRAGKAPLARLRAMPRAMFSPEVFTETNRAAFLAFWHEIRFNPPVREANRKLYVGYRRRVETLFAKAAAAVGVPLDPVDAATGLIAIVDGLWLELSIGVGNTTRQKAVALCQAFIDQQLGMRGSDG